MSSGSTQAFRPAGTAIVAASTTASAVALNGGGSAVLVYNAATTTAFFRLGAAAGLVATASDTPVPPGTRMLVDGGPFVSYAAAILGSGTGVVYFTLGDGDTY
jgi:hypothetical protein